MNNSKKWFVGLLEISCVHFEECPSICSQIYYILYPIPHLIYPSVYLCLSLSTCLAIYLLLCLTVYLSIYLYLSIFQSSFLCMYVSSYHLTMHLPIYLYSWLAIKLSTIYPATYLPISPPNSIFIIWPLPNPSSRTVILEFTQPLTEMSTRKYFWEVERGRLIMLAISPPSLCSLSRICGIVNTSQDYRLRRPDARIAVCPFAYLSTYLFIYKSVCLCIFLYVYLFISLFTYHSVTNCLPIFLSYCIYVCIYPST
jgi:hypothetical protein